MNFEKTITIDGDYIDFKTFHNNNIEKIYNEIIECFKEFKDSSVENVNLLVKAKIQNLDWDSEFKFDKLKIEILIKDILPYYEKNEFFEKCSEIKKLYNHLNEIKKGEN
jgi:hypothetical protein